MWRPALSIALMLAHSLDSRSDEPWTRHTIDDSFRGADGVRLADFNHDGLPDIVTGWEESGIVRLYLNPGTEQAARAWPAVSVGQTAAPEDAVPVDIDRDGNLDVVSCHEGKARKLLVHFNRTVRSNTSELLKESNWETAEFSQLNGQLWMFATPIDLPGSQSERGGRTAIVTGSKGGNASITLLLSPPGSSRDLSRWQAIRLRDAGWIMSIRVIDMDGDGDQDIVFSDRKGSRRGVGWLEQPNADAGSQPWVEHMLGAQQYEVMFIDIVPGESAGAPPARVLVATRNSIWIDFHRRADGWIPLESSNPPSVPHGKAIAVMGDSLVMTANTHSGDVEKVPGIWFKSGELPWQAIGTAQGGKFDRIELIDLNGDAKADVLTCEERQNLGVVWYEHP